jgi:hypothetical protein
MTTRVASAVKNRESVIGSNRSQGAYSNCCYRRKRMNSQKSSGGYWMLLGLVALLAAPMAVGYYVIPSEPAPTVHADATN